MPVKKSVKDLRAELEQLSSDLEGVAAQIAAADTKIAELTLPAMRGDRQAEKSLSSVEESKSTAQTHQHRLEVARTAVESELVDAIAIEHSEAERVRLIETAEKAQRLRERANELDAAARVLVATYGKFRNEAASLGLPRLRTEIVNSACRRALTSHLPGTGLALELIAPNQRRTFADIVNAWTVGIAHARNSVSANANSQTVKENINV